MTRIWIKAMTIAALALSAAACSTYPDGPRYPIRPVQPGAYPAPQGQPYGQPAPQGQPGASPYVYNEPSQPEPGPTAPAGAIDGGALPPAGGPPARGPDYLPEPASPVAGAAATLAYTIQPGDTVSGVGRRFRTPVQTLIDLNSLGPRGAITPGQRILLPGNAIDGGLDPYATGPSPVGVEVAEANVPPPPPPPVSTTPAPRPTDPAPAPAPGALAFDWPVRGDIVRPFGPAAMGERNNGINIGASAGAEVRAAAPGRVAYVGDDLVGQGLTVLLVHADGWRTVYGHLGSATVRDGDQLRAGQQLGTVGVTAGDGRPSMHFEIRQMRGDDPVAVDPTTLLPR